MDRRVGENALYGEGADFCDGPAKVERIDPPKGAQRTDKGP